MSLGYVILLKVAPRPFPVSTWDKAGRKGKVALFRRLATWGEGGLMSKNQFHERFSREDHLGRGSESSLSSILHLRGGLSSYRTQRCFVMYIPWGRTRTLPNGCTIDCPPLFLHSLSSLINNCLNLPFGTQRKSRRLNEAYFLTNKNKWKKKKKWETQKGFYLGGTHRVLLCFTMKTLKQDSWV